MVSRTSRILFVVALVAVGAFVFLELPGRRARDRADVESTRFVAFDPPRVDALTIERPDETLTFVLRDANWDMTAPVSDLAEPSAVASLLRAIEAAAVVRDLGPGGDNAVYGFDPPAARVTLAAGADTLGGFELGGYTVDRAWVYARAAGSDRVVLVPTDLMRAATLPVDAYRNRRVVVFELSMVAAYRLETPRAHQRWTRAGSAWFTLAGADTVPGDSVAVEAVLRRLRGMRVASFVAAADTAGAFDRADGVVRAEKRDGPPLFTVRFARRDSTAWARVDGETRVVVVDGDVEGLLAQTTTSLRDRRLLHFSPARAMRIAIATADTAGVLVRALRALQWTETAPALERLPVSPPVFSLVVAARGDTILEEMRAWPRPGGSRAWIVTSRSNAGARLVDPAELDRIAELLRRVSARAPRP